VVEEAVVGPTHPRGPGAVVFAKVVVKGERKGDREGGVEEEVVGGGGGGRGPLLL